MAKRKTIKKKIIDPVRAAAVDMSKKEMQYLLEAFFMWQRLEMATNSHTKILTKKSLDNKVIKFIFHEVASMRENMALFAGLWAENHPAAKYMKDNVNGIGPISAAGLAAYIDIDKCKNYYSSVWSFAGLAPNSRPYTNEQTGRLMDHVCDLYKDKHGDTPKKPHEDHIEALLELIDRPRKIFLQRCKTKGEYNWKSVYSALTRPYYSEGLHTVCISLGNSIIKHKSMYQDLFRYRFNYELQKSESGEYQKRATKQLQKFNYSPKKVAYKQYIQGKIPDSHIANSARRWAIKVLLAHYYMIEYYIRYDKAPPDVYGLAILKGNKKLHFPGDWSKFRRERFDLFCRKKD